ncbi:MAG: UDP-N-acetylmuramoyl-L-alanine--D-glutamate ligase, partial [bacterium]
NVGSPFIGLAGQTKPENWLVIEVSSYQLETIRLFRPYIAVLLNIAEDHLERHGEMRVYIRMKGHIFEKQHPGDHAVVNFDDPTSLQAYGQAKSALHGFSLAGKLPGGAWLEGNDLLLDKNGKTSRIIGSDEFKLIGDHNRSNALAAILACHLAGCNIEKMREGLRTFRGLPHRLEPIAEVDNILWVNDSKATNIHSTINALNSFERPVVLLLGGYDKGLDVTPLIPCLQRHVRHVVLLGATRNRFKKALNMLGYSEVTTRKTLPEACSAAKKIASPGDIVLLSPGSSSFDQFKSYIHRGEVFRKWVETKVMGKEK